jgi:pimeloyl-ACP methyl ester carboxylesterase
MGVVLDALGLARADVAAYSFGGLYAMLFMARSSERVGKLALCSSVPAWHGYRDGLDRILVEAQSRGWVVEERATLERSGMRERSPEEYRRRRFALSVAGYFKDPRLAHGLTPFRVQANVAEALRKALGDFDFRDVVRTLDGARVLVVHGEDDPIDAKFARETASLCGARLELIPACGHVPYVEAAERFFVILRSFLGDPS